MVSSNIEILDKNIH